MIFFYKKTRRKFPYFLTDIFEPDISRRSCTPANKNVSVGHNQIPWLANLNSLTINHFGAESKTLKENAILLLLFANVTNVIVPSVCIVPSVFNTNLIFHSSYNKFHVLLFMNAMRFRKRGLSEVMEFVFLISLTAPLNSLVGSLICNP